MVAIAAVAAAGCGNKVGWLEKKTGLWFPPSARVLGAGDASEFVTVACVQLDPSDVGGFATRNALARAEPRRLDSVHGLPRSLQPGPGEWLYRRDRVPNDKCRLGCHWECGLEPRTARVWIWVELPDLSGD
jgi:hypothetical protein